MLVIGVITNTFGDHIILLDESLIKKIEEYFKKLVIPIDTFSKTSLVSRNVNHCQNIRKVLEYVEHTRNIDVEINTVVTHFNYYEIRRIYEEIVSKYQCISNWNLFEFAPLRGKAIDNSDKFLLQDEEDKAVIYELTRIANESGDICINYKHKDTLLSTYFVISPNGDIVRQTLYEDILVGNLLYDDLNLLIDRLDLNMDLYHRRMEDKKITIV